MLDVIAKTVLESKDTLAEAFRSADPFPHVVIDGFFNAAFCERLLAEFPPFASGDARNELGTLGGKAFYLSSEIWEARTSARTRSFRDRPFSTSSVPSVG